LANVGKNGQAKQKTAGKLRQLATTLGLVANGLAQDNPADHPPALARLTEFSPLLDELDEIGRMHECRMSPVAVRMVAVKLRRLVNSIAGKETPS
jgi:hypothetical protein